MCTTCNDALKKTDDFADDLISMMNGAALTLMMSVGHRTGLFNALQRIGRMASSQEIADEATLNERYVREWLYAMTTGRIVVCDDQGEKFQLPAAYEPVLCSTSPESNIAVLCQYISIMGKVEDKILTCFKEGGGLGYDDYDRFHEGMADDSNQWAVAPLFDRLLPMVDGIEAQLETGIDVMDLGCGRGKALLEMASRYPKSRFLGYDLCADAIEHAQNEVAKRQFDNIRFEIRDLTGFNVNCTPESCDFICTFDAVHDQARPDNLFSGIFNSLRPGGRYLMVDINTSSFVRDNIGHPLAPLFYCMSLMHCMSVSLGAGGLGLGTCWGVQLAEQMLRESGFVKISKTTFDEDPQNVYFVCEK